MRRVIGWVLRSLDGDSTQANDAGSKALSQGVERFFGALKRW
jgi:hypothetical protein